MVRWTVSVQTQASTAGDVFSHLALKSQRMRAQSAVTMPAPIAAPLVCNTLVNHQSAAAAIANRMQLARRMWPGQFTLRYWNALLMLYMVGGAKRTAARGVVANYDDKVGTFISKHE